MAKNEIIFTGKSPAATGTGVAGRPRVSTGQLEVERSLGSFGAALGDLGAKLYRVQGEAELTEKMFEANETFQQLHKDFLTETDPDKYEPMFQQAWGKVQNTEIKNGWARRRYQSTLPSLHRSQLNAATTAYKGRVRENHEMAIANVEAQYIRGETSRKTVEALYHSHSEIDPMTEDEINLRLTSADDRRERHLSTQQYNTAADGTGIDPEGWLATAKRGIAGETIEGFEFVDPRSWRGIKNLAEGSINERDRKLDVPRELIEDVYSKAQTMNLHTFRQQLTNTQGLSAREKTDILDIYMDASKKWQDTGINPWTQTDSQGYAKLTDILINIRNGKITDPREIDEIWLENKTPNFAFNHWQMANNALENSQKVPSSGYSRTHTIMQEYIGTFTRPGLIGQLYLDDGEIKDTKGYTEMIAEMERYAQSVWGEPDYATKINKHFEELSRDRKQMKSKGYLRRLWEVSNPLGLFGRATGLGPLAGNPPHTLFSAGMQYLSRPAEVIQVNSLAEAEKLKSGAQFEWQGKTYTRK
jgi:hypothetical protein